MSPFPRKKEKCMFLSTVSPLIAASTAVAASVPILVLFHMTGCPYCKGLPGSNGLVSAAASDASCEYRELESNDPVAVEVNQMGNPNFSVTSFPSIGVLTPKKWVLYKGPRTREGIASWLLSGII